VVTGGYRAVPQGSLNVLTVLYRSLNDGKATRTDLKFYENNLYRTPKTKIPKIPILQKTQHLYQLAKIYHNL
jgi:hypothetical protein